MPHPDLGEDGAMGAPDTTPEAHPEAQARRHSDALLNQAGWMVQDRGAVQLGAAGEGVAVRELPTAGGEADYGLFLGRELVGVVEAKKLGATLGGVEAQTLAYASETLPGLTVPIRPLPFRYESTGVETFFTDGREPKARAECRQAMDEDLSYEAAAPDRSGVVPDQIRPVLRTICERLFTEIFPGRAQIPKLLFFAKSNSHAEDILRILRQEWSLSNEQAVKITYQAELDGEGRVAPSKRPEQLIRDFATSYDPRVAVTVDMIATGTDIKPLEGVVFLRMVRSKALFEQMKGRGVRVMPDADFQAISPDGGSKTQFVLIDCVGVMEAVKADPPLDRDPTVPFARLLELVRLGTRDEEVLSALAAKLDRIDRRLKPEQQAQ